MTHGTTTSQSIKHQLKMPFPAVTICNSNAVMIKKMLENEQLREMIMGTSATSDLDSANTNGERVSLHCVPKKHPRHFRL